MIEKAIIPTYGVILRNSDPARPLFLKILPFSGQFEADKIEQINGKPTHSVNLINTTYRSSIMIQ